MPQIRFETSWGPGAVDLDIPVGPATPVALLVLGHGAGGDVDAPDLIAVRDAALLAGYVVARVTQPYRLAGRRAPAPARQLDEAFVAAVGAVRRQDGLAAPALIVGGRSSGARVACRTATAVNAEAVVALAFPVHPPGRPERSRLDELDAPTVPVLVVQGERDPFGRPPRRRGRRVVVVPGDHALRVDPATVGKAVVAFARTVVARA